MDRIKKLEEFLQQNPADSFLKHALALEYIKLGNDNEGQKFFEEIVAKDPDYIGTYYHLAKLLERKGDNEGAISIYEKGMQIAKKNGERHAYGELKSAWEELTS